jgi:fatty acid-binding protein DegV
MSRNVTGTNRPILADLNKLIERLGKKHQIFHILVIAISFQLSNKAVLYGQYR